MSPAVPPLDDPAAQAGARLLNDLRGEITRADTKATVLVGALGISAGVLAALLTNHRWLPARLPGPAALLWWAGAASLVIALFASLLAVMPRYGRSRWTPGRPLTYFGDIQRAVQVGGLTAALGDTGHAPVSGLLLALAETSGIASRKHFWIRTGLIAFASAAVLLPGSMLLA